ncbi:hypothetical protein CL654_03235 [bacterium]|nr:hypothetical protein [bacterium]|tara:strand:- start:3596 stop:3946 length:351 start_codon:yes stop_codon:yes gene_type:complete
MTRSNTRSLLSFLPITLLIIVIALYSYGRARDVIFGPEIAITYPEDGSVLMDDLLVLQGNIKNAAFITLNGRQIFVDEEGTFNEKLLLHYGYNIIEIEAEDRFNQKEKKRLQVVYR